MTGARGYSLVELMVGLALAALVLAGAVQMHWSFNRQAQRQQEIAELQQTLRTAMKILERAVRSAGRGLPSSHALTCTPLHGFQFSDDNPDSMRVVAADDEAILASRDGSDLRFWAARAQSWQPGDLLLGDEECGTWEIARGFTGTPTQSAPGSVAVRKRCDSARDDCRAGAALHHFSARGTVYRVTGGKLMMSTDDTKWIPLADGIEDLQIAVVGADGAICDDARAAAVRLTLVGRSPTTKRSLTSLVQLRNYAP